MARYVADGVPDRLLSELHNTIDSGTDIRFHQRLVDHGNSQPDVNSEFSANGAAVSG